MFTRSIPACSGGVHKAVRLNRIRYTWRERERGDSPGERKGPRRVLLFHGQHLTTTSAHRERSCESKHTAGFARQQQVSFVFDFSLADARVDGRKDGRKKPLKMPVMRRYCYCCFALSVRLSDPARSPRALFTPFLSWSLLLSLKRGKSRTPAVEDYAAAGPHRQPRRPGEIFGIYRSE